MDGKIKSKLEFIGEGQYPACQYIGIKTDTSIDQVGPKMKSDFDNLMNYARENAEAAEQTFSIYHKFDMVKRKVKGE